MIDELADDAARDRPDRDRGEHRRREQADGQPDASAPTRALATQVVAGLAHGDVAVLVVRDKDDALDLDLLIPDPGEQPLEVLRRLLDALVAGDEHVGVGVSHLPDLHFGLGKVDS